MADFKQMLLFKCLIGPKLYSIFAKKNLYYEPNTLELIGGCALQLLSILKTFSLYSSPFILYYCHRNGHLSRDYVASYLNLSALIACVYSIGLLLRGAGRYSNNQYVLFLENYFAHLKNSNYREKQEFLKMYDFDLTDWPSDFVVNNKPDTKSFITKKRKGQLLILPSWKRIFFEIMSYVATHTFALKMAYPGATSLMQLLLGQTLTEGRFNLISRYKGIRAKLGTWNGEFVDVMFVDKRQVPTSISIRSKTADSTVDHKDEDVSNDDTFDITNHLGSYLLIVCEGNASYYEIGCMTSFLGSGLSVLGWNHPGFGESTGQPLPDQEIFAIHAVIEYATTRLGFPPDKILFYGWSIGSFTAAWGASHLPNNRALILDAAFDDILPLAVNRMPNVIETLVVYTVRKYLDLRTVQNVIRNKNPNFVMIRRTQDEIMNMREGDLSSNRGNHLIVKILRNRYPSLFTPDIMPIVQEALAEKLECSKERAQQSQREFSESESEDHSDFRSSAKPLSSLRNANEHPSPHHEAYTDDEESESDDTDEVTNGPDSLSHDHVTSTQDGVDVSSDFTLGAGMTKQDKIKLAYEMLYRHLVDYDGSHCDPLPKHYFLNLILNL